MKRIILIFTAFCILLLSACASSDVPLNNEPRETEAAESAETEEKKEVFKIDDGATIEKQVLLDRQGIRITALSLDYSGFFGPQIVALVENGSSHNITVQSRNASVNGAMVESNFTLDIPAGESREDTVRFSESDLEIYGITVVNELEFGILISDSQNWETVVSAEQIRVVTSAEPVETELLADYSEEVYNRGGIRICAKKEKQALSPLGVKIFFGIENNTERSLKVQTRQVAVDGTALSSAFSSQLLPQKTSVGELSFSEWELSSLNVEGAKQVSFRFVITDPITKETVIETEALTLELGLD